MRPPVVIHNALPTNAVTMNGRYFSSYIHPPIWLTAGRRCAVPIVDTRNGKVGDCRYSRSKCTVRKRHSEAALGAHHQLMPHERVRNDEHLCTAACAAYTPGITTSK